MFILNLKWTWMPVSATFLNENNFIIFLFLLFHN